MQSLSSHCRISFSRAACVHGQRRVRMVSSWTVQPEAPMVRKVRYTIPTLFLLILEHTCSSDTAHMGLCLGWGRTEVVCEGRHRGIVLSRIPSHTCGSLGNQMRDIHNAQVAIWRRLAFARCALRWACWRRSRQSSWGRPGWQPTTTTWTQAPSTTARSPAPANTRQALLPRMWKQLILHLHLPCSYLGLLLQSCVETSDARDMRHALALSANASRVPALGAADAYTSPKDRPDHPHQSWWSTGLWRFWSLPVQHIFCTGGSVMHCSAVMLRGEACCCRTG